MSSCGSTTSRHASTRSAGQHSVATGGLRDIPSVHQHIDQPVTAVHAPGNRAVRHGTGCVHGSLAAERGRRSRGRSVVRRDEIVTENIALQAIAHLFDGFTRHERGHPQVAFDDVGQECGHVPVIAGRRVAELTAVHIGHNAAGVVQSSGVDFRQVDAHDATPLGRSTTKNIDASDQATAERPAVCHTQRYAGPFTTSTSRSVRASQVAS